MIFFILKNIFIGNLKEQLDNAMIILVIKVGQRKSIYD